MSAHVLLNLLNDFKKIILWEKTVSVELVRISSLRSAFHCVWRTQLLQQTTDEIFIHKIIFKTGTKRKMVTV